MKIINFGSLNIDRVYTVEHFVRPGETLNSSTYNEFAGGKGLNQSIALARAGAEVLHVGKIGRDGEFLKQLLLADGIDVSHIQTIEGPSGHAIIQVTATGENSIILEGGANRKIIEEDIRAALTTAGIGDWILLQNEISQTAEILSRAAEHGLNVVFNPAPMTPEVRDLPLQSVRLLIVNEVEGEMIAGQKRPDRIIDTILTRYPNISLVLTMGSSGVHYASEKIRLFVPAETVTPVDTTGAGDTFVGYFIAGITRGMDIKDCLTLAARAAAMCVMRSGAAASIPKREEL